MEEIVIYCKSYRHDFLRLKRLLNSINKFNTDQIRFYISTPKDDYPIMLDVLGPSSEVNQYDWVSDESIVLANPRPVFLKYQSMTGSLSQAIIKSEFWRLNLSENYLCIDSDSIFLRPFRRVDFLGSDRNPYTVLHQNKELFQLAIDRGYSRYVNELNQESEKVKKLFDRDGPNYFCAPSPFIWSSKVWQSLDEQYLKPNGITLWELIENGIPETLIYGETLLKYRAIPIRAIEPLFRTYHFDWQYYLAKRLGETEKKIKENYMGVIYQSNWESELHFGKLDKSRLSRILKSSKRILRRIQSYF